MIVFPARSFTLALLASTCLSGGALAVDASGTAVKVDPAVNASGTEGARLLEVEGAVFMGDEIVAGPNGLAQIRFVDDTKIVIGPNSRLKIDSFVFNANNTAKDVTVSAIKGTFRFISGKSPHEAYSIRTPTMTIGVRGTVVDIDSRGPDSSVVFVDGQGTLCDAGGACIEVTDDCAMHVAPRGGGFSTPTGIERTQRMAVFFPFTQNQNNLDPAFRAPVGACRTADAGLFTAPPVTDNQGDVQSQPAPPPPPPPYL